MRSRTTLLRGSLSEELLVSLDNAPVLSLKGSRCGPRLECDETRKTTIPSDLVPGTPAIVLDWGVATEMHKTVLDVEGFVGVDAHFGVEVGRLRQSLLRRKQS